MFQFYECNMANKTKIAILVILQLVVFTMMKRIHLFKKVNFSQNSILSSTKEDLNLEGSYENNFPFSLFLCSFRCNMMFSCDGFLYQKSKNQKKLLHSQLHVRDDVQKLWPKR